MTTEQILEKTQDLFFSHNRESVDVSAFDNENERLITAKNVSADLFLEHFEYGQTISDDREKNVEFLKLIL